MQGDDNDVIYEIAQTTARTEERARNIEKDVKELKLRYVEEAAQRDERLGDLETRVDRHDMILTGAVATVGASISAFFGWLFGLIRI